MTFIDELEEISTEVVDELVDLINRTIELIAPDGRGFLQQEKTEQEQITEYLQIRGDVNKWREWINQAESAIYQRLLTQDVPQEYIGLIRPRDIAHKYAVSWSEKMEGVISG